MTELSPDPWAAVEAQTAEIGRLAGEGDRYRLVRLGGAPALLDESLALAREARRLHRRRPDDAAAIAAIAQRLGTVVSRYAALIQTACTTDEYVAAVAAWRAGDGLALARLIPAVFAEVGLAVVGDFLYHPIPVMGHGNRPIDPATVAARAVTESEDGLTPAEPGSGTASDEALRAILLYPVWSSVDSPVALRLRAGAVSVPFFRLRDANEILVYAPRLSTKFDIAVAATIPDQERWPEVGVDYVEYRDALAAALAAAGHPATYLPP
jgi:hypothetical protein